MKIAFLYLAYPFAIASYFRRALERMPSVELCTVGPFHGQSIPWDNGMTIPIKYLNQVDLPLPPFASSISWETIKNKLPWTPDLIINVDAGFHLSTKPDVPYYVVATDPHVLEMNWYSKVRPLVDKFFNMQSTYMQDGDIWLPYAFDPTCHYALDRTLEYDCSIIGIHYPQRNEWVSRLRAKGVKVNYRIGDIYDEYREENNKAWIGLNWSSLEDVTARVFEIMAMELVPVLNRLPGLDVLGFEEGAHYLGFSSMDEAVEKVMWATHNREQAKQIAHNAHQFVHQQKMTYDTRVSRILAEFGV